MGEDGDGGGLADSELEELLCSTYGWSLEYVWDDRVNRAGDADLGLTAARLDELLAAREKRTQGELSELAHALAISFNEPSKLGEVFAQQGPKPVPGTQAGFEDRAWWQNEEAA